MKTSSSILCASLVFAHAVYAGEAEAFQEPLAPVEESSDQWSFKLSLYAPVVDLDGTSRVGANVVPIDLPFSDIFDNLDGGLILAGEAQKGKFSIIGDLIWLKLSNSSSRGPLNYNRLRLQQTIGNLALGYQLYQCPQLTVDGLVGAAYTSLKIDSDLAFGLPGAGAPGTVFVRADESWVDPFIGIRARYKINENWRAFGRVEYGGFGIGSENYFQAIIGGGYQFNEGMAVYLAYRHLMVDYEKAAFAYDVETSGPQIGVVFQF